MDPKTFSSKFSSFFREKAGFSLGRDDDGRGSSACESGQWPLYARFLRGKGNEEAKKEEASRWKKELRGARPS